MSTDVVANGTAGKSLVMKLAEVMAAVERIPKRGRNDFHGYDYATEADIAATIRMELASRHVMLIPGAGAFHRDPVGEKGSVLTTLAMTFTFYDGESGESIERPWFGAGTDKEDKGLYKAFTGGEKYFLLKTFLMPTGDDPEREDGPRQPQAPKRASKFDRSPEAQAQRREEAVVKAPYRAQAAKNDWGRTQVLMKKWPPEIAAMIPPDEALYKNPEPDAEANREFYIEGVRAMAERRKLSDDEIEAESLRFFGSKTAQLDEQNIYVLRALWKYLDPERP